MAIQQGTGYRDPAKTMTIKALQDRQKQAQLATAKAVQMPQQISDPWQAAAHVMGVAGSRMNELSAGREEAASRAQLSQIMSGIDPEKGATMQQIGQMQQLDPDFANKEYERMMTERANIRNREDTQQFQHGESELTRQHEDVSREDTQVATAEQNNLNRQADLARQKMQEAAADNRQDDQQAAAEELARIQSRLDEEKAKQAAQTKVESIGTESAAREAEADRLGMPKGPERDEFILTGDIKKPASTNVYNQGEAPAFEKKSDELAATRLDETVRAGQEAGPFLANLRIVADLGKQIGTGKAEEFFQPLLQIGASMGIPGIENLGSAEAYKAIVDKLAPTMRVAGAGPSSDFDARQFLSSLPSLGRTEQGNAIIQATFEALGQHKMAAAEIAAKAQSQQITWQEAEAQIRALPNPYDQYKKIMAGGGDIQTDTGDGGEDESGAPVFDPAQDKEGDTGTDAQGNNWIVKGNQWVQVQ